MSMDRLLSINRQKQLFQTNIEFFLQGKFASHVLLWGAKGTGKSSLVKATLNDFHSQGLRIIEILKDDLSYLTEITDKIHELKQQFIIFL